MRPRMFLAAVIASLIIAIPATIVLSKQNKKLQIERVTNRQLQLKIQTNEKIIETKENEIKEKQKQNSDLQQQLQSKKEEQARIAATQVQQAPTPVFPPAQVAHATGGGDAKMFIYLKESGNNPGAVNGSGCRGLGQACPGSKLPCSNSDYACQDAFFTNYAISRYGSWENAKAFWLAHSWW